MDRAWIMDGPWIARNIVNASVSTTPQIKNCEAYINCPNCSYCVHNNNVLNPWAGLPKGVKFEPTDEEVIEHLEAKCGINGLKPHSLIHDFICSVTQDVGINYTHPQNLPGVNKDGISVFYFNKTAQAYQNGQRKRRRITPTSPTDESVRWHKTGRTKPVILNGVQRGSKRIMVLYKSARDGLKPEKSNWVLHQYHLGTEENEIGEFVVSKIIYHQQKQWEKTADGSYISGVRDGLRTPKTTTPTQSKSVVSVSEDEIAYDDTRMVLDPVVQGVQIIPEPSFDSKFDKKAQVTEDLSVTEDNLKRKNTETSSSLVERIPNLETEDLGSLPDFLYFASEDSLLNWLEWL